MSYSTIFDERLNQTVATLATKAEEKSAEKFSEKCATISGLQHQKSNALNTHQTLVLANLAEMKSAMTFQQKIAAMIIALANQQSEISQVLNTQFFKPALTETNTQPNNVIPITKRSK